MLLLVLVLQLLGWVLLMVRVVLLPGCLISGRARIEHVEIWIGRCAQCVLALFLFQVAGRHSGSQDKATPGKKVKMATSHFTERTASPTTNGSGNAILSPTTPSTAAPRSNALQNRITSVLSASYADVEIRDALSILDARDLTNSAATRRNLRLDVQRDLPGMEVA